MAKIADTDILFLKWLYNRLIHKYGTGESEDISIRLKSIINHLSLPFSIDISTEDLDKIINKYYADFYLDKSETLGFTEEERNSLRKQIREMCEDIVNKNIGQIILK